MPAKRAVQVVRKEARTQLARVALRGATAATAATGRVAPVEVASRLVVARTDTVRTKQPTRDEHEEPHRIHIHAYFALVSYSIEPISTCRCCFLLFHDS